MAVLFAWNTHARLELRICMEELLARTNWIALLPGGLVAKAVYPGAGFSVLPLCIK